MSNEPNTSKGNRLRDLVSGKSGSPNHPKRKHLYCLNCGKVLIGRTDRKFCCQRCHDNYNNAKKASKREEQLKIIAPMEKNDKFLAELYAMDKHKEWPMAMLDHPGFNGEALNTKIKDDRIEEPGKRYINYSCHSNIKNNTFKILDHGLHYI
ncbi:MAG: hypothetical protein WC699_02415 [Bacteroidales bacterium]|jgi:hypothetical protein